MTYFIGSWEPPVRRMLLQTGNTSGQMADYLSQRKFVRLALLVGLLMLLVHWFGIGMFLPKLLISREDEEPLLIRVCSLMDSSLSYHSRIMSILLHLCSFRCLVKVSQYLSAIAPKVFNPKGWTICNTAIASTTKFNAVWSDGCFQVVFQMIHCLSPTQQIENFLNSSSEFHLSVQVRRALQKVHMLRYIWDQNLLTLTQSLAFQTGDGLH